MRCIAAALIGLFAALAIAAPARAQGNVCQDLWIERNAIYKASGYCFKTARAIAFFGNAGCIYDVESSVPLSQAERMRIQEIRALERQYGCR